MNTQDAFTGKRDGLEGGENNLYGQRRDKKETDATIEGNACV